MNTAFFKERFTKNGSMVEERKGPSTFPDPILSEYEVIRHVVKELESHFIIITPINGIEWPRFGETEEDSWVNLLASRKSQKNCRISISGTQGAGTHCCVQA